MPRIPEFEESMYSLDVPSANLTVPDKFEKATQEVGQDLLSFGQKMGERKAKGKALHASNKSSEENMVAMSELSGLTNPDDTEAAKNMFSIENTKYHEENIARTVKEQGLPPMAESIYRAEYYKGQQQLYQAAQKQWHEQTNTKYLSEIRQSGAIATEAAKQFISKDGSIGDTLENYAGKTQTVELAISGKSPTDAAIRKLVNKNSDKNVEQIFQHAISEGKYEEVNKSIGEVLDSKEGTRLSRFKRVVSNPDFMKRLKKANEAYSNKKTKSLIKDVTRSIEHGRKETSTESRSTTASNNALALSGVFKDQIPYTTPAERATLKDSLIISTAKNTVQLHNASPLIKGTALDGKQMADVLETTKTIMGVESLTANQRTLIENSAREEMSELGQRNAQLVRDDTKSVVKGLFPGLNDEELVAKQRELGLNASPLTLDELKGVMSDPKKLTAALIDMKKNGTVPEFKQQVVRENDEIGASPLQMIKVDQALRGGQPINDIDWPPLTNESRKELKAAIMGKDNDLKSYNEIEASFDKKAGKTAEDMGEKNKIYNAVYSHMVQARTLYWVRQHRSGKKALSLAQDDTNKFFNKTYTKVDNELGYIINREKDEGLLVSVIAGNRTVTKIPKTKHLQNKMKKIAEDMKSNPQKYFDVPEGAEIVIKPGIMKGMDISPYIKVNGKLIVPFQKKIQPGDTKTDRRFHIDREFIENWRIN